METLVSFKFGINKGTCLLQFHLNGSSGGTSVPSPAFFGKRLKKVSSKANARPRASLGRFKVVAKGDEKKQIDKDRWKGLVYDV